MASRALREALNDLQRWLPIQGGSHGPPELKIKPGRPPPTSFLIHSTGLVTLREATKGSEQEVESDTAQKSPSSGRTY